MHCERSENSRPMKSGLRKKFISVAVIALCGMLAGIGALVATSATTVSNATSPPYTSTAKSYLTYHVGDRVPGGLISTSTTTNGFGTVSYTKVEIKEAKYVDGFTGPYLVDSITITFKATPYSGYKVGTWTLSRGSGYSGAPQSGTNNTVFGLYINFNAGIYPEMFEEMHPNGFTPNINIHVDFVKDTTPYTLTATAGEGGSIPSAYQSQTVINGELGTVKAVANYGWNFLRWEITSGNGNAVITDSSKSETTVKVSGGNVTVRAIFQSELYTLALYTSPTGAGTVSANPGQAGYEYGTEVKLTATPNSGYILSSWTVNGTTYSASGNTRTITITSNTVVTANFTVDVYAVATYTLNAYANPGEAGRVGIDLVKAKYKHGEKVTLTLTQLYTEKYTFSGWIVTGSGYSSTNLGRSSTLTITMTSSTTVCASFAKRTFVLSGTGFTRDPAGTSYDYGTTVTLTASPELGYVISGWTVNQGGNTSTYGAENIIRVTITSNTNVTTSTVLGNYTLAVNVDSYENSTLMPVGTGGYVTQSPTGSLFQGCQEITFNAQCNEGYSATSWTVTRAGMTTLTFGAQDSITVAMYANTVVTVILGKFSYTLNINQPVAGGTISADPDMSMYARGTDVTLNLNLHNGYEIIGWMIARSGLESLAFGVVNSVTIEMLANTTVSVNLKKKTYTLTGSGFSCDPSGTVHEHGTLVTLTATPPSEHQQIASWTLTIGDKVYTYGSVEQISFFMLADATVATSFKIRSYSVDTVIKTYDNTTLISAVGGEISNGGDSFEYNTILTLTATTYEGFKMMGWTVTIGNVSTDYGESESITITITSNVVVTANFSKMYKLEVG